MCLLKKKIGLLCIHCHRAEIMAVRTEVSHLGANNPLHVQITIIQGRWYNNYGLCIFINNWFWSITPRSTTFDIMFIPLSVAVFDRQLGKVENEVLGVPLRGTLTVQLSFFYLATGNSYQDQKKVFMSALKSIIYRVYIWCVF